MWASLQTFPLLKWSADRVLDTLRRELIVFEPGELTDDRISKVKSRRDCGIESIEQYNFRTVLIQCGSDGCSHSETSTLSTLPPIELQRPSRSNRRLLVRSRYSLEGSRARQFQTQGIYHAIQFGHLIPGNRICNGQSLVAAFKVKLLGFSFRSWDTSWHRLFG